MRSRSMDVRGAVELCYGDIGLSNTSPVAAGTRWVPNNPPKGTCFLRRVHSRILRHLYSSVPVYGFQEAGHFESATRNTSLHNRTDKASVCTFKYAKPHPPSRPDSGNVNCTFTVWCNVLTIYLSTLAGNNWENLVTSRGMKRQQQSPTKARFLSVKDRVKVIRETESGEKESWPRYVSKVCPKLREGCPDWHFQCRCWLLKKCVGGEFAKTASQFLSVPVRMEPRRGICSWLGSQKTCRYLRDVKSMPVRHSGNKMLDDCHFVWSRDATLRSIGNCDFKKKVSTARR
jgi:hypothetical protein